MADRLRAPAHQLGLTPAHVAEMAGVNRSFVYDVLRGRSARPGIDGLAEVARVLKVDRDWLIPGIEEVEGTPLFVENSATPSWPSPMPRRAPRWAAARS